MLADVATSPVRTTRCEVSSDSVGTFVGQLLDRRLLAALLRISVRSLNRFDAAGKIPMALRLGGPNGRKRWCRAEIERWVAAGCPDRKTWLAIRRG
jgi:predicted DNA-binding transcriptional regulator AlpA